MKFLVLGGGAQGSAAAFDLVRQDEVEQVILADRDISRLAPFLVKWRTRGKLVQREVDASDEKALETLMQGMDGVLCALPYYFNVPATRAAIRAKVHLCDLGGNTAIVEEQLDMDDEAREAGISVIPDCGLAPGMVNILAQAGIDALDEADSVKMFVGGLPRHPVPPVNYQIVYSMEGVIDYYTTTSMVLRDYHPANVEALSEVESVEFPDPVGTLEAFHTAGGVSTLPFRHEGKVRTMEYKTLRYPGHAELMKGIRALGLFETEPIEVKGCRISPREFFIEAVTPKLRNPLGDDVVVLRVEVAGTREGKPVTIRYDLIDYHDRDNLVTAMMRTTGYSLAVTALMQAKRQVRDVGAETSDLLVPADAYIEALAQRGIRIRRSEH